MKRWIIIGVIVLVLLALGAIVVRNMKRSAYMLGHAHGKEGKAQMGGIASWFAGSYNRGQLDAKNNIEPNP